MIFQTLTILTYQSSLFENQSILRFMVIAHHLIYSRSTFRAVSSNSSHVNPLWGWGDGWDYCVEWPHGMPGGKSSSTEKEGIIMTMVES